MSHSYKDVKDVVETCFAAKIPCLIWGPPGIGKSALVKDVAKKMTYTIAENPELSRIHPKLTETYGQTFTGRRVSDVRLALMSPTTIMGIPVYNSETRDAVWCMSGLFPTDPARVTELERLIVARNAAIDSQETDVQFLELVDRLVDSLHQQHSILFLDELGQAPPATQAAAFGLLLDRKIQSYSLPVGVDIVSATNNNDDRAGVNRLSTPLVSRLAHVSMGASIDDWKAWAAESGIDTDILAFVTSNAQWFHKFDPSTQNGSGVKLAFPCPRTWEMADRALKSLRSANKDTDERIFITISGCVGEAAANQFIAWRNLYRKLPSPEEILSGRLKRSDVDFTAKDEYGTRHDVSLELCYILDTWKLFSGTINRHDVEKRAERMISFITTSKNKEFEALLVSVVVRDLNSSGNRTTIGHLMKNEKFSEMLRNLLKDEVWESVKAK